MKINLDKDHDCGFPMAPSYKGYFCYNCKKFVYDDCYLNNQQPDPILNDFPFTWDLVIEDMKNRDKLGLEKYKVRLQPLNGRDDLIDAYQEALDLCVYLRNEIYRRNGK